MHPYSPAEPATASLSPHDVSEGPRRKRPDAAGFIASVFFSYSHSHHVPQQTNSRRGRSKTLRKPSKRRLYCGCVGRKAPAASGHTRLTCHPCHQWRFYFSWPDATLSSSAPSPSGIVAGLVPSWDGHPFLASWPFLLFPPFPGFTIPHPSSLRPTLDTQTCTGKKVSRTVGEDNTTSNAVEILQLSFHGALAIQTAQ
ncbi:hypothetical protein LZ30DRAFT_242859 [Colletotrichum cereale]|nr:hypothetical protein LZ30DRAFT_242859 [Colletotrichum cereale]